MTLSRKFDHVQMTYPCPKCGHGHTRPGAWFMSVPRYRCEGCGAENRITYDDRLRLQHSYAATLPKVAEG